MSTIDPRFPVTADLQARLASLRPRAPAAGASRVRSEQPESGASAAVLAQRIAAIDTNDPDRRRKAVRIFLEGELARTFGLALLNDPSFPALLDSVQDQMQQDTQAAAAVHALGDWLLAGRA